jgi:hypothetical protein
MTLYSLDDIVSDTKSIQQQIGLIVRRGALRRFAALTRETAGLPVTVSWDQRQNERRASNDAVDRDHRQTERRAEPSFTWELADFVVAEPNAGPTPRSDKS